MRFARKIFSRYTLLGGESLRQRKTGRVEVLQKLLLLGLGARLQEPAPAVLIAHVLLTRKPHVSRLKIQTSGWSDGALQHLPRKCGVAGCSRQCDAAAGTAGAEAGNGAMKASQGSP